MAVAHGLGELVIVVIVRERFLPRENLPQHDAEAEQQRVEVSVSTRTATDLNRQTIAGLLPVDVRLLIEGLTHHHLGRHEERRSLGTVLRVLQPSALLRLDLAQTKVAYIMPTPPSG